MEPKICELRLGLRSVVLGTLKCTKILLWSLVESFVESLVRSHVRSLVWSCHPR
jgi:hypothetical protein